MADSQVEVSKVFIITTDSRQQKCMIRIKDGVIENVRLRIEDRDIQISDYQHMLDIKTAIEAAVEKAISVLEGREHNENDTKNKI
jgi:hypothetical protein